MKQNMFLVASNKKVRLKDHDTSFTAGYTEEAEARAKIDADCSALAELQDKLMAQETYDLLLVFQAMDGSVKDGTIKHIMSVADPQGCAAHNFTEPSEKENKHDYLWRFHKAVPARGEIGVFNRSYYRKKC